MKTVGVKILFALALLLCNRLDAQNVVLQWNAIASTTIISNAKEGSVASGVWLAYVHQEPISDP